MVNTSRRYESGVGTAAFTILALLLIGAGLFWYMRWQDSQRAEALTLTPEAREYVKSLKLSDVEMKANESYLKQRVVEIQGKITNAGDRPLEVVELNCVFYDAYGQLVRRQRVPIVSARMGGLKPGETKSFRLPFDDIPDSWDRKMPQMVIAGMRF